MKIEAILVANAAMVDDGDLLNVEGACWKYIERGEFPTTVAGSVCGIVLVEDEDFGSLHPLSMEVFDDSGHVEGSAGSIVIDCRTPSEEMSVARVPFAFPFSTVVSEPTLLEAKVVSNGAELGCLSVIIRRSTPPDSA